MTNARDKSWIDDAVRTARVARLATLGSDAALRVVPICFAVVGRRVVGAVDHKPKRTGQLRRLDDIEAAGTATVLIDHYDEDWTNLWWVRIRGRAVVHAADDAASTAAVAALVEKYEQYRAQPPRGPVYSVEMDEIRSWQWNAPA